MTRAMRQVELEEDGSAPDATSHPEAPTGRPLGAVRRRRTLLALAGVAVAVVAALVIGQAVVDGRRTSDDAALAERYGHVPGVPLPFDETLRALWSVDMETEQVLWSGVELDGVIVGPRLAGDGLELVGLDADDGTELWSTPVTPATPEHDPTYWGGTVSDTTPAAIGSVDDSAGIILANSARCTAGEGDGPVAVCSVERGDELTARAGWSTWMIDPARGTVLAERVLGPGVDLAAVGDTLVTVRGVTPDGGPAVSEPPVRFEVAAADPVSGEEAWTWTSPDLTTPPTAPATLVPDGGHVLVDGGDRSWVLDGAGQLVGSQTGPHDELMLTRNGALVPRDRMVPGTDGTLQQEVQTFLNADDGTLPEAAFTVRNGLLGGGVVARRTDDEVLWTSDDARDAAAVLDGRVLVEVVGGVALLDGTDGTPVWSVKLGGNPGAVVTDGRTVLVFRGPLVQALSLATGRMLWERTFDDLGLDRGHVNRIYVPAGLHLIMAENEDGATILG